MATKTYGRCGMLILAIVGLISGCGPSVDGYDGIDVGDDCPVATPIAANSSTRGALEGFDDWDVFEVVVGRAGTLRAYTTGTTDTLGAFLDNRCEMLVSDDDGGAGMNFDTQISVSSPGGTFYVAVTGATEETTGPYTLHVEFSGGGGGDVGAQPENCALSWRLILEYEEEDLTDPGAPPRTWEWDAIDRLTFTNPGTWTGDSYDGYYDPGSTTNSISMSLSSDRSKVVSFYGSRLDNTTNWEISGGGVPVVLDSALLSTLKAYISGPAACDAVADVVEPPRFGGAGEKRIELTGFHCSSESYVEIYCD